MTKLEWVRTIAPAAFHPTLDRVHRSHLGQRLARGVFWSAIGAVVSRSLALLTSVVTARLIGKPAFGQLGVIQSTALMSVSFASFGMGLTATKHVAEFRKSESDRAGGIIGFSTLISWISGFVMAGGVAILAPWLAERVLAAPELAPLLRVGSIWVLLNVVSDTQLGTLNGFEAFKRISTIQLVSGVVAFPILVLLVYRFGLLGSVYGLIVGQAIVVGLNVLGIRWEAKAGGVHIHYKITAQDIRLFWTFSFPTLLAGLCYVPAIWMANAIVVNQPNGYLEMGGYNAADRWRTAIMFLPGLLGGVALPMLADLWASTDRSKYGKVLWTNVCISGMFSFAVAVPISLASRWIMAAYGASFVGNEGILVGLCAVAVISATSWILVQSVVSRGKMWHLLSLNATWATLLVGSCWIFRAHGAYALVAAYLIAEAGKLGLVATMAIKGRNRGGNG